MRSIRAVGYDLDYTLVHYAVEAWETAAYESLRAKLALRGWPVHDLAFDHSSVNRGLIIDRERGNLLKANRFGYVKHAAHGTRPLSPDEKKAAYARTVIDAADERYVFLNTLFSLSEAAMYAQVVDLLDDRALPEVLGYADLHDVVRSSLDEAHFEGRLKAEIMERPQRFVMMDPDVGRTLVDQKIAGLKLMVVTNSEWTYTRFMLRHAIDPHLPDGMTWRELFDLVIVSARKPDFFGSDGLPAFEVVDEAGLLLPLPSGIASGGIASGGVFLGGNAAMVERYFGLDGSEILFVGDHVYADVLASKSVRRWRTALILREIEDELLALDAFAEEQAELAGLMERKARLEHAMSHARMDLRRAEVGAARAAKGEPAARDEPAAKGERAAKGEPESRDEPAADLLETGPGSGHDVGPDVRPVVGPAVGPVLGPAADAAVLADLRERMEAVRADLLALDARIAPLAERSDALGNARWGPIMRAANDKSFLARQVEQFADVYTSRVSNFGHATPYANFRSPYGSLPHDPGPSSAGGA